jgi:hypothetical protein
MVSHAVPVLVYRSPGPVIGRDHSTVREGSPRLLIASCPVVATADVYSKSVTVVVKKKMSLTVLVAGVPNFQVVSV